ncbi:Ion channel regulatory protein unc-93 [Parelaphostrongylus tenuis]|uniref:Ion channel regulatory protein unc-93 n=1 Tax=Parelaphostrongylus tenuis TaxID=148309 RepID=A0AAD5MGE2_PARTN|nr:Ion channel regulatory protein unc-93 [Parelaphostrongylus tenuis]
MGDPNAWDMFGEPAESSTGSRSGQSDSQQLVKIHDSELQALGLNKEKIAEEAERQRVDRLRRSKSPALETIRKASIHVLQKLGAVSKKKEATFLLSKDREMDAVPLVEFCVRPREFYQEPKPFSFRDLGRPVLQRSEAKQEKCAYLFRGASYDQLEDDTASEVARLPEYDPFCPVHGSRRRVTRRQHLVSMQHIMSSIDHDDAPDEAEYLYNHDFLAKIIRRKKREQLSGSEKLKVSKVTHKIKANLLIISVAFLFLFSAFNGLSNLQTSVNHELGADSLAVHYMSLAVSLLFVPTYMIDRIGCKLTLITAMSIYVFYMAVNIRPSYSSLIPASVLAGVAGSCLWGAKCVYITQMGIRYAHLNFESPNTVIVRFFGYFFMIVHSGQVFGNLLSSYIMTAAMKVPDPIDEVYKTCGHSFPLNLSELSEIAALNLERPHQRVYLSVCLTYLACAIVAVMIVSMFLNALHKDVVNRGRAPMFDAPILKQTLKNCRNIKIMLLVPLTAFNGVEQAFVIGIFTKAFVGCGIGVPQIGFVCTAFGISDAICSLVFGPLIKLFGRMPLFVFGAVNNMLMIVTLMDSPTIAEALQIWPLNPADKAILYVAATVWGMADGVWNTQINGFWVALVGRQSLELAFSTYRFWESIGLAAGFVMARLMSVELVLLVSFCLLLLGMIGYCAIELYDEISSYLFKMIGACYMKRTKGGTTSMETSLLSPNVY